MSFEQALRDVHLFWGHESFRSFHKEISGNLFRSVLFQIATRMAFANPVTRLIALAVIILFSRKLCRPSGKADILCYLPTQNNRIAAQPVIAVFDELKISWSGFSGRLSPMHRLRALWVGGRSAARTLGGYRGCREVVAYQLLQTAAAYLVFAEMLIDTPAKAVLLANDHSPFPVALRWAARQNGLRVIYRQHAPVSERYPALECDLAVLWDRFSARSYQQRGASPATVVLLPPFAEAASEIKRPKRLRIWLMVLSRAWRKEGVERRLDEILRHPDVERIILKPHPENSKALAALAHRPLVEIAALGASFAQLAHQADLAIVPGSGAALFSLHFGLPTFYCADMDGLTFDPHGFVRADLLPDATARDLSTLTPEDNAFFDENWSARFCELDETQYVSLAHLQDNLRRAIIELLALPNKTVERRRQPLGLDNQPEDRGGSV